MKIAVLSDNNTLIDRYFLGEPAVCYYIECDGKRILFDTGYSDVFLRNAEALGIDLGQLTHIVLSHGHNDHTGGLKLLLERFDLSGAALIAHPGCFTPKYDEGEYIGAPMSAEELAGKVRYFPTTEPVSVTEHLSFLGQIPRVTDFEAQEAIGWELPEGKKTPDYLWDDSALVYRGEDGFFLITGCSHSGICNITQYAEKLSGTRHILGILGGFHLLGNPLQERRTAEFFSARRKDIDVLYPCHCVSLRAKAKLMETLPVEEIGAGTVICV